MRFSPRVALSTLAVAIAIAACGSDPVGGPGTVEAVLVSPNGAEGAVHLRLEGPGIGDISVAEGSVLEERAGTTVTLVAVRPEPGEIRIRVELEDVAALPAAIVLAVADGSNQTHAVTGYRVEWER